MTVMLYPMPPPAFMMKCPHIQEFPSSREGVTTLPATFFSFFFPYSATFCGNFTITDNIDSIVLAPYTCLKGNLTIRAIGVNSLNALNLISISGSLIITENDGLTDLTVMTSLNSIGSDLIISFNSFTNINGLNNLTSIGGGIVIQENDSLENVDGLNSLSTVQVVLGIRQNVSLENLDGLASLTSMGDSLAIWDNTLLPYCEVCDLLDQLSSTPSSIIATGNQVDPCYDGDLDCP